MAISGQARRATVQNLMFFSWQGHRIGTSVNALPPSMLRAVSECSELVSLRVMYHSIAAIRRLPQLRVEVRRLDVLDLERGGGALMGLCNFERS